MNEETRFGMSEEQIERYSPHIILPEFGGVGQRKLLASSALIVGAGGLGSPAALYLAAAGVGRLGLVDRMGSISPISSARSSTTRPTSGTPNSKPLPGNSAR